MQSITAPLLSKPSSENIWVLLSRTSRLFLWFLRGCCKERFPSFSGTRCRIVRKRLTDTKNESFLSSEWRLITQTPGRSLTVNLECAVKITVRLILGRAVSFKLSAPFYRNQAYLAGFLRQPCCRHRKGCYSLWCCHHDPMALPSPRQAQPCKSQFQRKSLCHVKRQLPWIVSTRSFEGAKTCIGATWVWRRGYMCSMLPPSPWAFQGIICNIPPVSEEFGDDVSSCPPVLSAKSVSTWYTLLLDKLLVWDAWDCTFQ